MMSELAVSLRDVLQETDETYIEQDPEDAFVDLASRLVLRLSRKLTFVPAFQSSQNAAAFRLLDILTRWVQEGSGDRFYVTRIDPQSQKIEIVAMSPRGVEAFFRGECAQDAYAQMAQTIEFNGGTL